MEFNGKSTPPPQDDSPKPNSDGVLIRADVFGRLEKALCRCLPGIKPPPEGKTNLYMHRYSADGRGKEK